MKDVPYFPCYAANIMASRAYRSMSLAERGLWISIYQECWVNGGVPSNFKEMAKILGFTEEEIKQYFSKYQTAFFHIENDQYISKELEAYRRGYEERREKQRLGGIEGAQRKKEKAKQKQDEQEKTKLAEGTPLALPQGKPRGSLSYVKSNSINSNQFVSKEVSNQSNDEWIDRFENAPEAGDYASHSRGS